MSYKLSPLADSDLQKIIISTMENWGNEQAKDYAEAIDAALQKLVRYPNFGRSREELYIGARSFPVRKHIVFYKKNNNGCIDIARILHQRMDPTENFSDHTP